MTTQIRVKATRHVWARVVFLTGGAIVMTQPLMEARPEAAMAGVNDAHARAKPGAGADAIRPFRVHFPDEALADLKRRIAATRWPDRETVSDQSQGVRTAKVQALVRYWGTDYDWRKVETKLNSLPQFITKVDGLDIHFIHVRSPEP